MTFFFFILLKDCVSCGDTNFWLLNEIPHFFTVNYLVKNIIESFDADIYRELTFNKINWYTSYVKNIIRRIILNVNLAIMMTLSYLCSYNIYIIYYISRNVFRRQNHTSCGLMQQTLGVWILMHIASFTYIPIYICICIYIPFLKRLTGKNYF